MITVDTNVLARYLTNDGHRRALLALTALGCDETIFVAETVLSETAWVSGAVYALPSAVV